MTKDQTEDGQIRGCRKCVLTAGICVHWRQLEATDEQRRSPDGGSANR